MARTALCFSPLPLLLAVRGRARGRTKWDEALASTAPRFPNPFPSEFLEPVFDPRVTLPPWSADTRMSGGLLNRQFGDQSVTPSGGRAQAVLNGATWWTSASWLISSCDIVVLDTKKSRQVLEICILELALPLVKWQPSWSMCMMELCLVSKFPLLVSYLGNTSWLFCRCGLKSLIFSPPYLTSFKAWNLELEFLVGTVLLFQVYPAMRMTCFYISCPVPFKP